MRCCGPTRPAGGGEVFRLSRLESSWVDAGGKWTDPVRLSTNVQVSRVRSPDLAPPDQPARILYLARLHVRTSRTAACSSMRAFPFPRKMEGGGGALFKFKTVEGVRLHCTHSGAPPWPLQVFVLVACQRATHSCALPSCSALRFIPCTFQIPSCGLYLLVRGGVQLYTLCYLTYGILSLSLFFPLKGILMRHSINGYHDSHQR